MVRHVWTVFKRKRVKPFADDAVTKEVSALGGRRNQPTDIPQVTGEERLGKLSQETVIRKCMHLLSELTDASVGDDDGAEEG